MNDLMGRNEYARHRGVDPKAVDKAEKSGRIKAAVERSDGGKLLGINWRLADELWARNTDPVEAARSGTGVQAPPALQLTPPAAAEKPAAPEPTGDQGNFLAARVKEAELRGELLELDKLERIGLLVPRHLVQREFAEIFSQLKNAALRIPDRKAQALAGETDVVRIHRLMSDEIRTVFDEFSSQLQPGGPAAGVAADAGLAGERETVLP